jgi:hypothetical protein
MLPRRIHLGRAWFASRKKTKERFAFTVESKLLLHQATGAILRDHVSLAFQDALCLIPSLGFLAPLDFS